MVRAILDGTKTQTRRVAKLTVWPRESDVLLCPHGQPGDRLWVRETCRADELPDGLDGVRYLADDHFEPIKSTEDAADQWVAMHNYRGGNGGGLIGPTVPPIHMPRWASRITLEITRVRGERLRDISEADAMAEGARECDPVSGREVLLAGPSQRGSFVLHYRDIWGQINGPGSWEANPLVWVVEFQPIDAATSAAVSR